MVNKKKREKTPKKIEFEKPGFESYRKTREDLTTMDKLHMALTELCFAINYCATISVWEYTFAPRYCSILSYPSKKFDFSSGNICTSTWRPGFPEHWLVW